jgi:hypothetical protein
MNDEKLIAEAYNRIFHESDKEFAMDDLAGAASDHEQHEADRAQVNQSDKKWIEAFVPVGILHKAITGVDKNGREFVTWESRYDDGDRYYYDYYVAYKGDNKDHEIEKDEHERLVSLRK